MTIIVVEIPHRSPAFAWVAEDWHNAALKAAQRDGQQPYVSNWKMDDITLAYERHEFPEAFAICEQHGSVVEASDAPNVTRFYAPSDAPSLEEMVRNWISRDCHSAHFLTSKEDVEEFVTTAAGHGAVVAIQAAINEASALGWYENIEQRKQRKLVLDTKEVNADLSDWVAEQFSDGMTFDDVTEQLRLVIRYVEIINKEARANG